MACDACGAWDHQHRSGTDWFCPTCVATKSLGLLLQEKAGRERRPYVERLCEACSSPMLPVEMWDCGFCPTCVMSASPVELYKAMKERDASKRGPTTGIAKRTPANRVEEDLVSCLLLTFRDLVQNKLPYGGATLTLNREGQELGKAFVSVATDPEIVRLLEAQVLEFQQNFKLLRQRAALRTSRLN